MFNKPIIFIIKPKFLKFSKIIQNFASNYVFLESKSIINIILLLNIQINYLEIKSVIKKPLNLKCLLKIFI